MKLRMYSSPSGKGTSQPTYGYKKRSAKLRRTSESCNDGRVVVSEHTDHSAREVCESQTSRGPDFVSIEENLYCDMCTHTLYNVCSETLTTGCYNKESHTVIAGHNSLQQKRDESHVPYVEAKTFRDVLHWGP